MEKKELIGRKVKGFAFETTEHIGFSPVMYDYINVIGTIIHYNEYNDSYSVIFDDTDWHYPASLIEQHLVPESQTDMDLLDKFALAALPSVIGRVSINLTHQAIAQHAYNIAKAMLDEGGKYEND